MTISDRVLGVLVGVSEIEGVRHEPDVRLFDLQILNWVLIDCEPIVVTSIPAVGIDPTRGYPQEDFKSQWSAEYGTSPTHWNDIS
jgi:hypothetical protein